MTEDPTSNVPETEPELGSREAPEPELIEDELLVEDVSIDGMCGVY